MASRIENVFIDKVHEDYYCSICSKVLDEPILTECCGQNFCTVCLNNWFRSSLLKNKTCPHCRSQNLNYIRDLSVKRKIASLNIYCPNRSAGCISTFIYGELNSHLGTCSFVTVTCTNTCGKSLLRKNLQTHCQQECPRRTVKCQHCGTNGIHMFITTGHLDTCPDVPLECPRQCGDADIKRKKLESHKQICPLEPVQCPFFEVGCMEDILRKDLKEHTDSNIQQHLLLAMTKNKQNQTQLSSLNKEHEMLRFQHQSLQKKHIRLKKEQESLAERNETINKEHNNLKSTHQELQQKFDNLVSCVSKEVEFNRQGHPGTNTGLQCIKTAILSSTSMLVPGPQSYCLHFTQESGTCDTSLRTPSFYLRPGYKMYLRCNTVPQPTSWHSYSHSQSRNLKSFSLILEKSKKEDSLPWPIPNEIEIAIKLEQDSYHYAPVTQRLCDKCNTEIDLICINDENMERTILTWDTSGQYIRTRPDGFYANVTLARHSCSTI